MTKSAQSQHSDPPKQKFERGEEFWEINVFSLKRKHFLTSVIFVSARSILVGNDKELLC